MWNSIEYFDNARKSLKLTKAFTFSRISGMENLEEILNDRTSQNIFAVDDTDDGVTFKKGNSFFRTRNIVVYVLKRYDIKNMIDREEKMTECRNIVNKIQSKILLDSNSIVELMFLRDRMPDHEIPGYFATGFTGKSLMITIDEPTELIFDEADWDQTGVL